MPRPARAETKVMRPYRVGPTAAALLIALFFPLSPALAADARPEWQLDWERALKAAEQEGELMVYTTTSTDAVLREVFQKKFPKIKVTTVTGRGFQLGQKVLAERRADKFIPDIFVQGSTTPTTALYPAKALDPVKPLLVLPDVVDPSKWWQKKHQYVDNEGQYIFMFEGSPGGEVLYNKNLVHPDELKSYWDLLNPRWKGKIVAMDPTVAGPASQTVIFYYHSPDLGAEFLRRLFGETGIKIIREDERLIDWVALEKFALGLFPRGTEVAGAEKAGLPVKQFPPGHFKEGAFISPTGLTVSFFNRAPHPSAAKIALNWFLSREGQLAWLDYIVKSGDDQDSMRDDIPDDRRNPKARRVPGVKYFLTNKYDLLTNQKPIVDLLKKSLDSAKP
jgi:iron(III) transport system substrate-binding protein